MRITKNSWFILALMVLILASGCKKEGCTDPLSDNYDPDAKVDDGTCTYTPATLSLNVTHKVGNLPFAFNVPFQDANGRSYLFRSARFHVSSPKLIGHDGDMPINKYLQINASTSNYTVGEVPVGEYHGFGFNIGVDSISNHSDPTLFPADHPLSLLNNQQDHWSWSGGYVFLKIEGEVDTSATMNGPLDKFFYFHIATDQLLTAVSLSKDFTINSGDPQVLTLTIDWEKAFNGVDLTRQSTQTNDNVPLAQQVMANFVSAITLE
jgi:hypothetical protein